MLTPDQDPARAGESSGTSPKMTASPGDRDRRYASSVTGPDEETSPQDALRRARIAVDNHMTKRLDDCHMWKETTATDILLSTASPRIQYAEFNTDHEKEHGADWLWCWVDRDGTTFCLLVQAKILKTRGRRWAIDFAYRTKGDKERRPQISKLIAASDRYEAAAAYVLYCGDAQYRATLECDRKHDGVPCRERDRVGVSAISALVAENAVNCYGKDAGVAAFHAAVPVEDIAGSDNLDTPIVPLTRGLPKELARFLRQPQRGARRAARGQGTPPSGRADQDRAVHHRGPGSCRPGGRSPLLGPSRGQGPLLGALPRARAARPALRGARPRTRRDGRQDPSGLGYRPPCRHRRHYRRGRPARGRGPGCRLRARSRGGPDRFNRGHGLDGGRVNNYSLSAPFRTAATSGVVV